MTQISSTANGQPSSPEVEGKKAPLATTRAEILLALGAFVAFCLAVLLKGTQLLEPDDAAYQASIMALTHGHYVLSDLQYQALNKQLSLHGGMGIVQWVQLKSGQWASEKNPGYPFYAVIFQFVHALRAAPLFAGALASGSIFIAARRWLGKWGGSYAVILFLASGAAISFAWRATMSSFSDASFVAAGIALILWTLLAQERKESRRALVGLLGFVFLEIATAMRYTNAVVIIAAVITVAIFQRWIDLHWRVLAIWFATVALSAGAIFALNNALYGGGLKTGYASGLITFAFSAIWPNLHTMPWMLIKAIPQTLLALVAIAWILLRLMTHRRAQTGDEQKQRNKLDLAVASGLAFAWLLLWGLYAAYTWTVQTQVRTGFHHPGKGLATGMMPGLGLGTGMPQGGQDIHLIRFYLPAIGIIALLAAWTLMQIPRWVAPAVLLILCTLSIFSYASLTAGGGFGHGHLGNFHGIPGGPLGKGGLPKITGFPPGGFPKGMGPGSPGSMPKGFPSGGFPIPPGSPQSGAPSVRP